MDPNKQINLQLNALYSITHMLCSSFDVDDVLEQILGRAVEVFNADAGSVLLLDGDVLTIRKALKLSDEIVRNTKIRLGQGIVGHVAQTGEAMLLNGRVDDARFSDLVKRTEAISSSMCAPMVHDGVTIGVVTVRRSGSSEFSEDQLEFFKALASQAAMAIEIARLYNAERSRSERLSAETSHMQAIFSHMADAVLVFTGDFVITFANELAQNSLCGSAKVIGEDLRMFFPAQPWKHICEEARTTGGVSDFLLTPVMVKLDSMWRGYLTCWKSGSEEVYVLVMHDVTERERVERMKTEFMSSVSHELKTPLTSIIGFQELMIDREMNRERQLRCLNICYDEAKRLLRLIEDILMVAKLENGTFRVHKTRNVLDTLLAQSVSNYAERFPSYIFTLSLERENVVLDFDDVLINQVLENLLSNAVKYTPKDGHITVRMEVKDSQVIVSVADNGMGISHDNLPFLFEKFYRVDNSLTRHTGGVGLGLANTRHILEEHGGTIWVESQEGVGSTFYFSLPLE